MFPAWFAANNPLSITIAATITTYHGTVYAFPQKNRLAAFLWAGRGYRDGSEPAVPGRPGQPGLTDSAFDSGPTAVINSKKLCVANNQPFRY
jgi:hypothetical protein